jgi:hypothetical protein
MSSAKGFSICLLQKEKVGVVEGVDQGVQQYIINFLIYFFVDNFLFLLKVYVDNANSLPRALDNYYANLVSLSV